VLSSIAGMIGKAVNTKTAETSTWAKYYKKLLKAKYILNMKKIGTIGAGRIAKAFAKHVVKMGNEIILSNKTGNESLDNIIRELGPLAKAGSLEQVLQCDIILFSIPWKEVKEALSKINSWRGQILIDTTNAATFPDFKPFDLGGKTSSQLVAELAPGAKVVKAFNTLESTLLALDPQQGGGNRVLFFSADDLQAKQTVEELMTSMGFAGVYLGGLSESAIQQFGGPLITRNFILLN
jgi:predicted dinucleotide-binding enzyme